MAEARTSAARAAGVTVFAPQRYLAKLADQARPVVEEAARAAPEASVADLADRTLRPTLWRPGPAAQAVFAARTSRPDPLDGTVAAARARAAGDGARRSHPCPDCDGTRWVERDDGRVERCRACDGTGHRLLAEAVG